MSQQNDIEQIELSIEEAQKLVKRAEAARRLAENPDFRELISEGYFTGEAARLANIISHPTMLSHKESILNDIMGIGALRRYLSTIIQMGDTAEREIFEAQQELDEIRSEKVAG